MGSLSSLFTWSSRQRPRVTRACIWASGRVSDCTGIRIGQQWGIADHPEAIIELPWDKSKRWAEICKGDSYRGAVLRFSHCFAHCCTRRWSRRDKIPSVSLLLKEIDFRYCLGGESFPLSVNHLSGREWPEKGISHHPRVLWIREQFYGSDRWTKAKARTLQ